MDGIELRLIIPVTLLRMRDLLRGQFLAIDGHLYHFFPDSGKPVKEGVG